MEARNDPGDRWPPAQDLTPNRRSGRLATAARPTVATPTSRCRAGSSSSRIWSLGSRPEGSSHRLLLVTVARLWHAGSIPPWGNNTNIAVDLDFIVSERRESNPRSQLGKSASTRPVANSSDPYRLVSAHRRPHTNPPGRRRPRDLRAMRRSRQLGPLSVSPLRAPRTAPPRLLGEGRSGRGGQARWNSSHRAMVS